MTFEPVMCDASFRESKAVATPGVRFLNGRCRICGQSVGAVVLRPGIARINFHYREGRMAIEALGTPERVIDGREESELEEVKRG
jgi:hypothetical protein